MTIIVEQIAFVYGFYCFLFPAVSVLFLVNAVAALLAYFLILWDHVWQPYHYPHHKSAAARPHISPYFLTPNHQFGVVALYSFS